MRIVLWGWVALVLLPGCTVQVNGTKGQDSGATGAGDDDDTTGDDDDDNGAGDDDDDNGAGDDDDDDTTPPDDGLSRCAGLHSGSYEGDQEGVASAELFETGVIEMVFVNFIELEASGTVTPGGVLEGTGYGIRVEGTYDFDDCSATGTWEEIFGDDAGTWNIAHD